jgi:ribosomal protein L16 Arg81 hydroxylase
MDLSLKIDTVESITKQMFLESYFYPQKPVIIKGLLKNTKADWKWSLYFMKQQLGSTLVDVFDNKVKRNSAYTLGDIQLPFSRFIDIIEKNEQCDYRLFLFNGFKHAPHLRKDFPCPKIFHGALDRVGLMFFGGKNTDVRMHYDIDMCNVLHTQFVGKKRVLLFSPEYSELMYRLPFSTFSIALFDNPDFEKHPGLQHIKGYDITLEHGDTLFMPSGYWHYMTYLEGGFAVTYRKLAPTLRMKYQGIRNITIFLLVDKLMNAINESGWKSYRDKATILNANKAMKHKLAIKK